MRLNLRILDDYSGRVDHVVLVAEAETSMADVMAAVGAGTDLFVRGRRLPGDGLLADSGLHDGDVLLVGAPGPAGNANGSGRRAGGKRHAPLELAVVGGPLSGRTWPLSEGEVTLGRSAQADIRLDDTSVSRIHCRLTVDGDGFTVDDAGSTNGTWVGGVRLDRPTRLRPGQLIEVGTCLLEVRAPKEADADLHPDDAGGLAFNRPARIRPARREASVAFPGRQADRDDQAFPWAQVATPAVPAVAGLLFWGPQALLFPVVAVANAMYGRRRQAKRTAKEQARHDAEVAEAQALMFEAAEREVSLTRHQFPDPPTLAAIATGPNRRLWERREHDLDAALLRVGVADRPASIAITSTGGRPDQAPPRLPTVPVGVDLAQAGVLGVAGPPGPIRAAARWLVAQLTTLRSPRDLQLVVLTDADAGADWDWIRWLPHIRPDDPQAPPALVGNDRTTREERVKELLKVLEARAEVDKEHRGLTFTPTYVVVFDGIRPLRSVPGVPRLLREGPAVGIYAIGLDRDVTRLAEEGRAQLVVDPDDPTLATLEVDGVEEVGQVLFDQVDASWADDVARSLAPIRDTGGEDGEATIPKFVRFVELADLDLERPDDIASTWLGAGRTTEALVGVSIDGPLYLDLKRDGPHALVAGTTGAGKSEFLQTVVASLAVANRPSAMNFVLVDYKGASAFADCERLPHTVGMVTNLDGHLTERALVSLDAELKRREHVLKDMGVPDVDSAWERDAQRSADAGLARLVIVIDEFAELVRELPDFVSGLIRIARVGRSLGVHLILATQRPAGVVSPEMKANTGLRVALRMEDKQDSSEVLDAPNAASITRATPGRGYVRTGGRAVLVEFQTARVAGRRKGATVNVPPPRVASVPWNRLGHPMAAAQRADDKAGAATDLSALVEIIGGAAARAGLPRPRSPWLPPLPTTVLLPEAAGAGAVIGMEDLPAAQAQRPATFDLVGGSHVLIAGSARSGRSSALRTIAASVARSTSPSDVHLYGLDFGNGALLPLDDLPHCGGVVVGSETGRVERLVARLGNEVARRLELLARSGLGDIGEQRQAVPPSERLPYLVVLLDRWEGFTAQFSTDTGSELPAAILRLVREGAGVGLRLVIAGDRSLLMDRMAAQVEDKLVLRLADRNDYRLANLNPRTIPEDVPPGRAFRADSGSEVQFALLDPDPSGQAQAAAVRELGRLAHQRWPAAERDNRPFRVDALPTTIGFDRAWALAEAAAAGDGSRPSSPLRALVGVGGDELAAVGVDLAVEGGFVVAGPGKTGRSTALLTIARSVLASGGQVLALCPRPSPLTDLGGERADVLDGVPDGPELATLLAGYEGPLAIVIDDAEVLARTPADDAVKDYLRAAGRGRVAVVVGGQLDDLKNELRGTIVEAKKSKAGLLLSPPSTLDGDLIGLRLPRNLTGRMPPGRAVLGLDGEARIVQVPR